MIHMRLHDAFADMSPMDPRITDMRPYENIIADMAAEIKTGK